MADHGAGGMPPAINGWTPSPPGGGPLSTSPRQTQIEGNPYPVEQPPLRPPQQQQSPAAVVDDTATNYAQVRPSSTQAMSMAPGFTQKEYKTMKPMVEAVGQDVILIKANASSNGSSPIPGGSLRGNNNAASSTMSTAPTANDLSLLHADSASQISYGSTTSSGANSLTSHSSQIVGDPNTARYEAIKHLGSGVSGTVLLIKDRPCTNPAEQYLSLKLTKYVSDENCDDRYKRRRDRAFAEADCIEACDNFAIIKSFGHFFGTFKTDEGSKTASVSAAGSTTAEDSPGKFPTRVRTEVKEASKSEQTAEGGDGEASEGIREETRTADMASAPAPNASAEGRPTQIEDRVIAVIMELADCGDLRQELKHRRAVNEFFRPIQAGLLFTQLMFAVHHMHSRGIFHRDLKPANVLMVRSGLLKVGDFGFAKRVDPTEKGDVDFLGTAYYIAPEIWNRKPYGPPVDIYALGVILYEILMLKRPFTGSSLSRIQQATVSGVYEEPTVQLPLHQQGTRPLCLEEMQTFSTLISFIEALLRSKPEERPTAQQIVDSPAFASLGCQLLNAVIRNPLIDNATRTSVFEGVYAAIPLLQRINADPQRPLATSEHDGLPYLTYHPPADTPPMGNLLVLPQKRCVLVHMEGSILKESAHGKWKIRFVVIRTVVSYYRANGLQSPQSTIDGPPGGNPAAAGSSDGENSIPPDNVSMDANASAFSAPSLISSQATSITSSAPSEETTVELVMGVNKEDIDAPSRNVRSALKEFTTCSKGNPADFQGKEYVFRVHSDKWRTLSFQAANSDEQEKWVRTLNALCGREDIGAVVEC